MRLKNFFIAASAAFLLITSQQARAEYGSPLMEQQLLHYQMEYGRAGMYLYELKQEMEDAKKSGNHHAYKDARKAFRDFEKIFKRVEKAYKKARKGNYVWIPVPGWNPWGGNPGRPGQGGECTRDPGPCLKCEDGFIVPDDGDNPRKRCYQCEGGVAVQANGHPCNDYNPWTVNDVCQNGKCKGYPGPNPSPSLPGLPF